MRPGRVQQLCSISVGAGPGFDHEAGRVRYPRFTCAADAFHANEPCRARVRHLTTHLHTRQSGSQMVDEHSFRIDEHGRVHPMPFDKARSYTSARIPSMFAVDTNVTARVRLWTVFILNGAP